MIRRLVVLSGAVALAAMSCTTEVTEEDPTVVHCPSSRPAPGDACDEVAEGVSCNYDDECENLITFECDGATWAVTAEKACPCPSRVPSQQEPCFDPGQRCDYGYEMMEECTLFSLCTPTGWNTQCT